MFSISTQRICPEFASSFAGTKVTPAQIIYCLLNEIAGAICNSTVFQNSLAKRGKRWRKQNPTSIVHRQLCCFNITVAIKAISWEIFLQIFNFVMKSKDMPLPPKRLSSPCVIVILQIKEKKSY